jgi:hypothetical protein
MRNFSPSNGHQAGQGGCCRRQVNTFSRFRLRSLSGQGPGARRAAIPGWLISSSLPLFPPGRFATLSFARGACHVC